MFRFFVSSASVGRTCVFIALTNLIEQVKTEAVVEVHQTVKKTRQHRTAMVQTRVRINHNVAYAEKDIYIHHIKYHSGLRITKRDLKILPYSYYFNHILYKWTCFAIIFLEIVLKCVTQNINSCQVSVWFLYHQCCLVLLGGYTKRIEVV